MGLPSFGIKPPGTVLDTAWSGGAATITGLGAYGAPQLGVGGGNPLAVLTGAGAASAADDSSRSAGNNVGNEATRRAVEGATGGVNAMAGNPASGSGQGGVTGLLMAGKSQTGGSPAATGRAGNSATTAGRRQSIDASSVFPTQ